MTIDVLRTKTFGYDPCNIGFKAIAERQMDDMDSRPGKSGVARKAAAASLALVSIVLALIAYAVLAPDQATLSACISGGGSGSTCPTGGPIPWLIGLGGLLAAGKVWRG
jgi:hypothetical protein